MKWFCRLCWRHGDLFVAMPEDEAFYHAANDHARQVNVDMEATKVPAGMEDFRNAQFMDKYPGVVDCAEPQIEFGHPPKGKRERFDPSLMPSFDFEATNAD